MGRLVLGLDIGIASVGYGVIDVDNNKFVDYGVRLFKVSTASDNETRRDKRGSRRLKRRKHNRISDMKRLLLNAGLLDDTYQPSNNPYEVRVKGLYNKLTSDELCVALLHITKNRGSSLEDVVEDGTDNDSSKAILGNNAKELSRGKYICEIQVERLKEEGKVRGIKNNFKTDDYIKEVNQILSNQGLNSELNEKIIELIKRKRAYYEGPGSEKSPTPYGRWIDFGVEPIDLIQKMRGRCSVYPDELRAPKNSYTAELFNLLNDLNNLSINNIKLSYEDKLQVIEYVNENGSITAKQMAKILQIKIEEISGFRVDKNNNPLLTEFKGFKKIKKIFDNHNNDLYKEKKEVIDNIVELLTRTKGVMERYQLIKQNYLELPDDIIVDLSTIKGITGYHSLSFKAMRELNKELLTSDMNQMQLLHQLEMFGKNRKSTKGNKLIFADDEAILSPVAKRAQRETFKVVNALRNKYGEFDSIVVETTRDKNLEDQKKRINNNQKYYENINKGVDEILSSNGYNPSAINGKTKSKIRLYLEQDGKSAYTLQPLDLNSIINEPNSYEIDHIIPISVSLDDSINNKILATHKENQQKGNLTPIDAYLKGRFNGMGCDITTYQTYIKSNKKLSKKKKGYLLYEKDINKFSNIQEFIARNLVDTSYANRIVMNTLTNYFRDNSIDTKVHTVRGSATNMFRKRINLNKDREQDYMHHAIDALIVASIKKLNILSTYLGKYNINDLYDEQTGELFPVEEDEKVLDPKYIRFIRDIKTIYEESFRYYNGLIQRDTMQFKPIKISHKIDTKANRQIADETIYSTRVIDEKEVLIKKYSDIYEPKFDMVTNDIINGKYEKYLMYRNDIQTFNIIKDIVMNHFETYKLDPSIYTTKLKKGKKEYALKGNNNPLYLFKEENGKIHKYSKKNNGPEITSMKYTDGAYGSGVDVSNNYDIKDKRVVLQQISPYRTDMYLSNGKYVFITVRYKDVFYKKSINKYTIDKQWYQEQKNLKGISDQDDFVCSLHRDELVGIRYPKGKRYVYDLSTEDGGYQRLYDQNDIEILKFTATNNDKTSVIEVKPTYTNCKKRLMKSTGSIEYLCKYSTDVLGNIFKVSENHLKLEFDVL